MQAFYDGGGVDVVAPTEDTGEVRVEVGDLYLGRAHCHHLGAPRRSRHLVVKKNRATVSRELRHS